MTVDRESDLVEFDLQGRYVPAGRSVIGRALATLAIAMVPASLAACGSTHQSTPSTTSPSAVATTTTTSGPTATAAKPVGKAPRSSSAIAKKGAAGFRVPQGDNSIPDYGREAHASERQRAVLALEKYLRARANGEWSKMCDYLARGSVRLLQGGMANNSKGKPRDCGSVLAAFQRKVVPAERADPLTSGVAAMRVKGKSAFALFYGPNATKYVMPMQDEGGAWKMTQLAPLPYPLGAPTTG